MTTVSVFKIYSLKDIKKFLEVLSFNDDVKISCRTCSMRNKLVPINDSVVPVFDDAGKTCKKCVVSISRRKYAYLYIIEFLETEGKRYFTVKNIKRFIDDVFYYSEFIYNGLQLIINDLIRLGLVDIYKSNNNGNRYFITDENAVRIPEHREFLLRKGYGYDSGIKTVGDT